MIFAINKDKSRAYCKHSLLKAGNLLRFTAYIPLIMKWGVAKIWDFILSYCLVNLFTCPKFIFFGQNEDKSGIYCIHNLFKASNLFTLTAYMQLFRKSSIVYIWDLILVHFLGQFVWKSWSLPKMKENQGPTIYIPC